MIQIGDLLFDEGIIQTFSVAMQSLSQPLNGGYGSGAPGGGQYVPNEYFSASTQNRFGPLGEWVGYSIGIHDTMDDRSDMEVQWIPVQNKRKRFNTGSTGTVMDPNFSTLSLDENCHICSKNCKIWNNQIRQ